LFLASMIFDDNVVTHTITDPLGQGIGNRAGVRPLPSAGLQRDAPPNTKVSMIPLYDGDSVPSP
jgi:hypothetical protein